MVVFSCNILKRIFTLRQGAEWGGRGGDGGIGENWRGIVESDSCLSETSSRLLKLTDDRWKSCRTCCLLAGRTVTMYVISYLKHLAFLSRVMN